MKNFKVGDIVAPRIKTGKIISVTSDSIIVEVQDPSSISGLRHISMTAEQARLRGLTLEKLAEEYLVKVIIEGNN